jgi:hypothetical protein
MARTAFLPPFRLGASWFCGDSTEYSELALMIDAIETRCKYNVFPSDRLFLIERKIGRGI